MGWKDLHEYSLDEVKKVCDEKHLKPGRVKGTEHVLYFVKEDTERLEMIDWDTFENILSSKDLVVYGTNGGWMKIFGREAVKK